MTRRTIVFSESVDNELNQYINGTEFRNRSHAVESIVKEWLKWRKDQSMFDMRPQKKTRPLK